MPRICVVGSINMDLVIETPQLPVPGQTVLGGSFATHAGGKGANQAVAAARAGGQVSFIGAVGDDAFGATLREGLVAEGIDVRHLRTAPDVASGVALIAVDPAGQNTIIVASGANATVSAADVEAGADLITGADVLLLQLEVPIPVVAEAVRMASAAGVTVILNPAPGAPLPDDLLARCDYVIPNETEAEILTGLLPTDWESAEAAAARLLARGAGTVVITLGARGALLADRDGVHRQPAFPIVARDTTGAGDTFVGVFAVAIGQGHLATEAMRRAAAAGALACLTPGAQPSIPTAAAIDAFLAERGAEGID